MACKTEAPEPKAPPGPVTLTVFATGDVGSDTDVCGCKARRMGGIARRAKVLADTKGPRLVLDAGDLFFRNWTVSPRYEAQARSTAEFHADTLKHWGVPAMAVGERDLALGVSTLRSLAERADVKLLSANLRHTKSGTAAFDAYTIVERAGVKVGIVGASPLLPEKAQANLVYKRSGLVAEEPLAHVEAAAQAARKQGADIVIALLHVQLSRARQILDTVAPGVVDFAIVAHDRRSQKAQTTRDVRSAFIMPGDRGKWVVRAKIEVAKNAKGIVNMTAVREQQDQIKKIDDRIAAYKKEGSPSKQVVADREATTKRLLARKAQLEADLAKVDGKGRHRIDAELVPLDIDAPEDAAVLAMYRKYQDHLQAVNTGVTSRSELKYVGNVECGSCHTEELAHWKKTGHAKAWATMKKTRQTANLDCVPCHVTGFDRPGGPRTIRDLGPYVDVGCESCHGQGSAHSADPKVKLDYTTEVPEKVCAECHRAQEDQKPFVYEDRLPKVLGKGHRRVN